MSEQHDLAADLARTRSELADLAAALEQSRRANEAAHAKLLPVMRAVRRWAEKHRPVRCCRECEALFQIAEGRGHEAI